MLAATGTTCVITGIFIQFIMGTFFSWRAVALVSCFLPIFTITALFFIPESPYWLLTKGRIEEAQRSLCWLRGKWTWLVINTYYLITWLPDHLITWLPDYLITWSPDHPCMIIKINVIFPHRQVGSHFQELNKNSLKSMLFSRKNDKKSKRLNHYRSINVLNHSLNAALLHHSF